MKKSYIFKSLKAASFAALLALPLWLQAQDPWIIGGNNVNNIPHPPYLGTIDCSPLHFLVCDRVRMTFLEKEEP